MRKFLIAFLALLCLTLTGFAFACSKEPTYYILTYNEQPGVTYDFGEIKSGAEVREGFTVTFKVTFADNAEGSKEVSANSEVIKPDANGVYSFVMSEETLVTANAWLVSEYKVNFDMGVTDETGTVTTNENMMWYQDVDGNNLEELEKQYMGGDTVSFKIKTSVYCSESADDFRVTANTMVLTPDANGVYTFTVSDNTNINVVGLQTDEEMIYREDGSGTESDPFMIRKPIDLYAMAVYIEDSFYQGRYATMHYKLANDIDLGGERLYSIGEYPDESSIAMFCGTFDGDGHTISNYYLEDYIIDQTTGNTIPLANVGFFGVCSATVGSPVTIKNLNLKNFTIETDSSLHSSGGFYAGGLVGYGVGVNIINCTVDGTIVTNGNDDYFGNVGGIIGYQQSVYQSESVKYDSVIRSCSSNVTVSCPIGKIYSAGGIAGIVNSADETSNAYIIDSYSTGGVTGAMYTGGIAGTISSYASVANCYASGRISARGLGIINGSSVYATGYAGGIVGYASGDSIVSGCAFAGRVPSNSQDLVSGNIIGGKDSGNSVVYVNTREAVEYNNAQSATGVNFKTALGWSEGVWTFGNGLPTLKENPVYSGIFVTAVLGENRVGGEGAKVYEIDGYKSMAGIYRTKDSLPRYIDADNGSRSYGYFFDSELTLAVPISYVPMGAVTVYAGFADYSEVAGTYYFRTQGGSSSVFAELTSDGIMIFRNGALTYETNYEYDGANVILHASPATVLTVPDSPNSTDTTYTSYNVPAKAGKPVNGELNFTYTLYYNNALYSDTVTAVEDSRTFAGVYYGGTANAPVYTFYKDGSGMKGTLDYFTYTKNGNELELTYSATQSENAVLSVSGSEMTVNGAGYTAYDKLTGTWVSPAVSHETFTFDGKGGWKYKYAVYSQTGVEQEPLAEAEGTYEVTADGAVLKIGGQSAGTVTVTAEGFLSVNYGSVTQTYYKENSLTGTWTFPSVSNPTTIEFFGIGLDGYGKVHISHMSDMMKGETDANGNPVPYTGLDMLYEAVDGTVYIYDGDLLYGQLTYSVASGTLDGVMYLSQYSYAASDVAFCLYDVYYGNWVESTQEVTPFENVKFNGLGSYDRAGSAGAYTRVSGSVTIGGRSVAYRLTHSLTDGTFTYNGVEYSLSYDRTNDTVIIAEKDGTNTYTLVRAQA